MPVSIAVKGQHLSAWSKGNPDCICSARGRYIVVPTWLMKQTSLLWTAGSQESGKEKGQKAPLTLRVQMCILVQTQAVLLL